MNHFNYKAIKHITLLVLSIISVVFVNAQTTGITINNPAGTISSSTGKVCLSTDTLTTTGPVIANKISIGSTTFPSVLNIGSSNQFQVNSSGNLIKINGVSYTWPASQGGSSSLLVNDGTGSITWGSASSFTYWQQSGTNLFYTGGKVGIGITSPLHTLDIAGDVNATGNLTVNNITITDSIVAPSMFSYQILPMPGDSIIRVGNSGFTYKPHRRGGCTPDEWQTNAGIFAFNDSTNTGKVWFGVGTNHPDAALNVASVSGPLCYPHLTTLMFSITSPIDSTDVFTTDQNGNTFIPRGKMSIGVNGADMPGNYRLYVKGGILTEHCRVAKDSTTDWSDYVFSDKYKLTSLDSVSAYIKENHHLKDVPSAEEVTKNGIDVAQMDAQLLKKIEELTLYIIQLQKDNANLKQEIEAKK